MPTITTTVTSASATGTTITETTTVAAPEPKSKSPLKPYTAFYGSVLDVPIAELADGMAFEKTVKNPFFIEHFFAGMDVECDSTDARRSVKFITGPFAGTNIVEDKVGSASNGGYTYAFVNDEMTYPHPMLPGVYDEYKNTVNYIPISDTQTALSFTATFLSDGPEMKEALEAMYAGLTGLVEAFFKLNADGKPGESVCLKNTLFQSRSESIQTFPHNVDGVTKEFLSGALGAEVTAFESRVCAEGQVAMTVVAHSIVYADGAAGEGKPKGVALKISHSDGRENMFAPFYEKEIHVYTGWGESMAKATGIKIPNALGAWQINPTEGTAPTVCCIMMEDLTEKWIPFDPIAASPTFEETKVVMSEVAKMHKHFYKKESATKAPFSASGAKYTAPDLEPYVSVAHETKDIMLKELPEMVIADVSTMQSFSDLYKDNKYPWPAGYNAMMDLQCECYENESELFVVLNNKCMEIANTRPKTIIHGDLNSGNIWKAKDGSGILLADWQISRMAPLGTDFWTMLMMLDTKTTGSGNAKKLLEHYHAEMSKDVPGFADEYTVQMLIDDMAMFFWLSMPLGQVMNSGAIAATKAGLLPKDKADFTFQVLYPAVCTRFCSVVDGLAFEPILRSILDGTYDRWPGAKN